MSGWIKLHREIRGSKIWECEPFDRFKAWIDLLLLAQYKSGSFFKRHIEVFYQRGDVTHSIRGLAARWDWSRTRVESFLDDLVADGRIEIKKATVTTLISICNYELYQDEEPQESHRKATGKPQESPYKESKEGKEEISFVRFWDLVPRQKKQKRKDTEAKWNKLNDTDRLAALSHYPAFMAANSRDGYRYAPGPLPYINQRRWEDDDITPTPAPRKKVVESLGAPKSDLIWE